MEQINCTFPDCKNLAESFCHCNKAPFCRMHEFNHKQLSPVHHLIQSLYLLPNQDTKEALLEEIPNSKKEFNEYKTMLIQLASKIMITIEDLLQATIADTDIRFDKIITAIKETEKVSGLEKDPILNFLLLKPQEALERFKLLLLEDFEAKASNTRKMMKQINKSAKKLSDNSQFFVENLLKKSNEDLRRHLASFNENTTKNASQVDRAKQDNQFQQDNSIKIVHSIDPNFLAQLQNSTIPKLSYDLIKEMGSSGNELEEEEEECIASNYLNLAKSDISHKNETQCSTCKQWIDIDECAIWCTDHQICNRCRIKNIKRCHKCNRSYSEYEKKTLEMAFS